MVITEQEGFIIEAALEAGAEIVDDEGDVFRMNTRQLLKFAEMMLKSRAGQQL